MDSPGFTCFLFWNTWLYNLLRLFIWGDVNSLLYLILFICITECISDNKIQNQKISDIQITVIEKERKERSRKLIESVNEEILKYNSLVSEIITDIRKEHEEQLQELVESSIEYLTDCVVQKHNTCENQVTVIGKEHMKNEIQVTVIGKEHGKNENQVTVIEKEHDKRIQKFLGPSNAISENNNTNLVENDFGVKFSSETKSKLNMKMDSSTNRLEIAYVEIIKELIIDLQDPDNITSMWVFRRRYQC